MNATAQQITVAEEPQRTVAQSEASAVFQMIERAARDPSVDIDKLERMMAMQERMRLQEAERQFNAAMGQAQAEMPRVLRDATNDHSKSRYARLETISKAITPIITKHGFSLSFGTENSPVAGHHRVTCIVAHEGGFSRKEQADLPADTAGAQGKANKTAIQGFGSTVSYGRRYLTLLIFNVALTNEDDDAQSAGPKAPVEREYLTEAQADELEDLIDAVGADREKLFKYLKVTSLLDIFADRFADVKRLIESKRAKS